MDWSGVCAIFVRCSCADSPRREASSSATGCFDLKTYSETTQVNVVEVQGVSLGLHDSGTNDWSPYVAYIAKDGRLGTVPEPGLELDDLERLRCQASAFSVRC